MGPDPQENQRLETAEGLCGELATLRRSRTLELPHKHICASTLGCAKTNRSTDTTRVTGWLPSGAAEPFKNPRLRGEPQIRPWDVAALVVHPGWLLVVLVSERFVSLEGCGRLAAVLLLLSQ